MKKIILSLTSALFTCVATAQSCVSVQQVSTNYATKQITFDLKWGTCNNTNHLYRVWVFVDYRPVTITAKGMWSRAAISATDKGTLVSANKGVWVSGSANATQRVTLTLNVSSTKFDWCAIAIDYPPNATLSNGTYTLKGTPPFILNGNTTWSANTYTGSITAITDATNNPEGFINIPGCTMDHVSLGTVGFVSTQTWVVGSQTWSAPVTATYCRKTTFSGGSSGAFKSDCRSANTSSAVNLIYGDLFSWCTVVRYGASLCPSGWRVPTKDDFCILDKNLNSRSDCINRTDAASRNRYLNTWGAQYSGYASNGSLYYQNSDSDYWSQSEYNAIYGYALSVYNNGYVRPQLNYYPENGNNKNFGFALRCVK